MQIAPVQLKKKNENFESEKLECEKGTVAIGDVAKKGKK